MLFLESCRQALRGNHQPVENSAHGQLCNMHVPADSICMADAWKHPVWPLKTASIKTPKDERMQSLSRMRENLTMRGSKSKICHRNVAVQPCGKCVIQFEWGAEQPCFWRNAASCRLMVLVVPGENQPQSNTTKVMRSPILTLDWGKTGRSGALPHVPIGQGHAPRIN